MLIDKPTPAFRLASLDAPVSGGVAQLLSVYGRVPRGQNVPVGAYSQTVTVTVNSGACGGPDASVTW